MSARVKLPGLEGIRFFAATAIVLFHVIHFGDLTLPQPLARITSLFGFGVPLFYIVSAFGLYVGYAGRLSQSRDVQDFFLRRLLRIAPLFYSLMIITFAMFSIMHGTFISFSRVMTSLLFVFNLIPGHEQGFVMASWSIGVEMLFYAIFPLIVFAVTSLRRSLFLLALLVYLAAVWTEAFRGAPQPFASYGNFSLLSYGQYFASGIVGYFVWLGIRESPEAPALGRRMTLMGLSSIVILAAFGNQWIHTSAAMIGFAYAGMVVKVSWALAFTLLVVGASVRPEVWLSNHFTRTLGQASFSLYLWHPVILATMKQSGAIAAIKTRVGDPTLQFLMISACTLAILFVVSIYSYRHIEKPGMELVKRFRAPGALHAG